MGVEKTGKVSRYFASFRLDESAYARAQVASFLRAGIGARRLKPWKPLPTVDELHDFWERRDLSVNTRAIGRGFQDLERRGDIFLRARYFVYGAPPPSGQRLMTWLERKDAARHPFADLCFAFLLRRDVFRGDLKAGDPLPCGGQISKRLQLAPSTAWRLLVDLKEEGFLCERRKRMEISDDWRDEVRRREVRELRLLLHAGFKRRDVAIIVRRALAGGKFVSPPLVPCPARDESRLSLGLHILEKAVRRRGRQEGMEYPVFEHFRRRIVGGMWDRYRALPAAYALASEVDIPRQVITTAYDMLAEDHLVVRWGEGRLQKVLVAPRLYWLAQAVKRQRERLRRLARLGYAPPGLAKITREALTLLH